MKERKAKIDIKIIKKTIKESKSIAEALVRIYEIVIGISFGKIEHVGKWPRCNTKTASLILTLMSEKYDVYNVNLTWLNKGFGIDDTLNDNIYLIPENCYTLIDPEMLSNGYAQVEVEEIGDPPEIDSAGFDENDIDHVHPNKYYNEKT